MKTTRLVAILILSVAPLILGGCGGSKATNSPAAAPAAPVATLTSEQVSKERAQLAAAITEGERKLSELEASYKAASDEKAIEPVAEKARLHDRIVHQKAEIEAERKRLAELK